MTETREFHIGTVLSMMTGRLLSPNGVGDIYEIAEFLTGESGIMTHQLPRVFDEVEPHLQQLFPELAKVDIPTEGMDSFEAIFTWFDLNLYDRFGEMLEVTPMEPEDHTYIHPITELEMKMPGKSIYIVGTDEEFD